MGTIVDKFNYSFEAKDLIKDSINNLGGSITSETELKEYAQELDNIYDNLPKTTGEDTNLSLTTIKGKMNIIPKGDTSQNGTPTPDTPIDIEVVTGTQEVKVENVNLFNLTNNYGGTDNGITITKQDNGTYTFVGTATSTNINVWFHNNYLIYRDYTNFESLDKTKILLKLEVGSYRVRGCRIYYVHEDGTKGETPTIVADNDMTLTLSKVAYIVAVRASNAVNGTTYNETIHPMIYKGTTATLYTPHQEQTQTISLGDIELCKIGNYQDYLYKTSGKNVLELGNGTISNGGLTATITDKKTISMSGTSTAISFCTIISDRLNLEKGTYTLGAFNPIASSDSGIDLRITTTGGSGMLARLYLNVANNTLTFTLDEDLVNGRLIVRTSSGVTLNNFIITPMLVKGSTIGDYEPYGSGIWYKKEYIGKAIINGSENWAIAQTGTANWYYNYNAVSRSYQDNLPISNRYIGIAITSGGTQQGIWVTTSGQVRIRYGNEDTIANFKNWLSTNNVLLYYTYETPQDIEITDTNLITQLDNLEKLKSYNGVTNISSSGNLSAILSVSALKGE